VEAGISRRDDLSVRQFQSPECVAGH
jgi:hypothetical protein